MEPLEWSLAFTLTTPLGTLALNSATGLRYMLIPEQCTAGVDLRGDAENFPQADGIIIPSRWKSGYRLGLSCDLMSDTIWATGSDLVGMVDTLAGHLEAILNADGSLAWTPSGGAAQILDQIRQASPLTLTRDVSVGKTTASFAVDSALPVPVPS